MTDQAESRKVEELIATFEQAENDRRVWDPLWRDISNFVSPVRHLDAQTTFLGKNRQSQTYDDTAQEGSKRLAAAIHWLLISEKWFNLKPTHDKDDRDSNLWIDEADEKLVSVFSSPSTSFMSAMHESFKDLVSFGTCAFMVEDLDHIRFTTRPLFEMYPVQNGQFQVIGVHRKFMFTAHQAAKEFGIKNLSDDAFKDWESKDRFTRKREYLQAIMPRDDRDVNNLLNTNMPIASVFIDKKAKKKVKEEGFHELPVMIARWDRSPGETFGRSPASSVIDEIRLANVMKKTLLKAAEKITDPPLLIPDESMISPVRTNPGGLNYTRPGMSDKISQLPSGDPRIGVDLLQDVRTVIREAFFLDVIDLPLIDRMTATEVVQRRQDKLQIMSPFLSRIQEELLGPIIARTLKILVRRGELEEPPENLRGDGLEIEYISPLAVSQRTGKIQAFQLFVSVATPLIQADPELLENLDSNFIFRDIAQTINLPEGYMRPREQAEADIQSKRQTRQVAEQAAAGQGVAEALESGANAAKSLNLAV